MLDRVFSNITSARHKDLMNEVRREVVKYISGCVNSIPNKYYSDDTLKILQLLAHDRCSEVRKNVIDVFVRAVEEVKDKKQEDQQALFD